MRTPRRPKPTPAADEFAARFAAALGQPKPPRRQRTVKR